MTILILFPVYTYFFPTYDVILPLQTFQDAECISCFPKACVKYPAHLISLDLTTPKILHEALHYVALCFALLLSSVRLIHCLQFVVNITIKAK